MRVQHNDRPDTELGGPAETARDLTALRARLARAARCPQCGRGLALRAAGGATCTGCGAPAQAVVGAFLGIPVTVEGFDMLSAEEQRLVHPEPGVGYRYIPRFIW